MTKQSSRGPSDLFRREALEHHRMGHISHGGVLRLSPAWVESAYWIVLALALLALVYACVGRMNEYAEGRALVRAALKTDVTCPVSAVVREVLVSPGERVAAGQPLVQLVDDEQRAAVERYEQELQLQLGNSLSDPRDMTARRAVASVRSELNFARQLLELRRLTAPHDGVVGDVRTRPGQTLTPGQLVATLTGADDDLKLVMVIPGHFRPQLHVGLVARLELAGYAHAYESVVVDRVSNDVVGPGEARRLLGYDVADAVAFDGPVVVGEAPLTHKYFVADGRTYPFVDGLQGRVHIKVRAIPLILGLVPGLRYVYEGRNHGFPR
jgi:multidrug efflux pump subunit AcrA (membrane-fusion protein)